MTVSFDDQGYVSKEWTIDGDWRREDMEKGKPFARAIGLSLSSGADSALLLYIMAMSISKYPVKKRDQTIVCWHGINTDIMAYNSHDVCIKIIEVVEKHFPLVNIELYSEVIRKDENDLKIMRKPRALYFYDQRIKHVLGSTSQFPTNVLKENNMISQSDRKDSHKHPQVFIPFACIDKRKIADLYKKYDLMDDLFPLTRSCTGGDWSKSQQKISECPCKFCWWCQEKKVAFGMYDGGVT